MTGQLRAEMAYDVRIREQLDARWSATLGISALIHQADGSTILRADAMDQPALHGLLQRIRDLGLTLISVVRIDPDQASN